MAALAALVALSVACGRSDGDTGDTDDTDDAAVSAEGGVLFIDGEYIEPPYRIEVEEGRISLNGSVVFEFGRATPPDEVEPPDDPKDAGELTKVAGAMLSAIGWPERLPSDDEVAAIGRELEMRPGADSAVVEAGTLRIRDRDGGEERLLYWVRPRDDEPRHEQMAASMAEAWSRTPDGGGVLIIAGGATLSVPVERAGEFMLGSSKPSTQARSAGDCSTT